jgi:hypothetical protein
MTGLKRAGKETSGHGCSAEGMGSSTRYGSAMKYAVRLCNEHKTGGLSIGAGKTDISLFTGRGLYWI